MRSIVSTRLIQLTGNTDENLNLTSRKEVSKCILMKGESAVELYVKYNHRKEKTGNNQGRNNSISI